MSVPFTSLLINGQLRPASTEATFEVRNPYSNKVVGLAAAASSQDCKDAIDAAARAFGTWENSPLIARRDVFLKAADLFESEKYRERAKVALQEETAATDGMFSSGYLGSVNALRNYAGMVTQLRGETFPSVLEGGYAVAQRRAIGVVLAIAPWNAPLILSIRAVSLPIICGNTVVLKCSENSPRSQALIAELFDEAGLPNGVLNFISMAKEDSPMLTAEMIAHPDVRKINVNDDRIGKIIAGEAAKYLKPCVFELGGKAPVVVLNDADIPRAARAITSSALLHSGQICMSTERVIIQREAAVTLIPELTRLFSQIKAGDPHSDPSVALGALFTEGSAENVVNMIQEAKAAGAEIILGDGTRKGPVVQPHLLMGVKPGMRLWDQESFGPLAVLAVVDSIDEAVDLANESSYSLVAALWTQNVNTAFDVAARIRAGYTNINGPTIHGEYMRNHIGLGGATGYGHFDIDSWSEVRMLIFHSAVAPAYPIVG
ncbi:Vanillin dehydrogenase [Grifola frondosa]|uniref:Vanillin dehydrogenase n=1 Tax=Grifola frondosa TaxID=5627 RepID=A0A1C7MKS7_GRIFR|nr:Vanillin dehydrogenase [Grifola frondosa]